MSTESDDYENWKSAIQTGTKGQFLFLAWPTNMREVNSQVIQIAEKLQKAHASKMIEMNVKIF